MTLQPMAPALPRLQDLAAGPRTILDIKMPLRGMEAGWRPAGRQKTDCRDLPDSKDEGDRRIVRPQDGRRDFISKPFSSALLFERREIGAGAGLWR